MIKGLIAGILIWAILFVAIHGPFILGYIAMHLVTTGAFLFAIWHSDFRRDLRSKHEKQTN